MQDQANRLSNVLVGMGVQPGDRVAIVMPQRFETAVAYMAVLQMGAVAMPLSQLFGPEALEFRLQDSAAVVAIGDAQTLANVQAVRAQLPWFAQGAGCGAGRRRRNTWPMRPTPRRWALPAISLPWWPRAPTPRLF